MGVIGKGDCDCTFLHDQCSEVGSLLASGKPAMAGFAAAFYLGGRLCFAPLNLG